MIVLVIYFYIWQFWADEKRVPHCESRHVNLSTKVRAQGLWVYLAFRRMLMKSIHEIRVQAKRSLKLKDHPDLAGVGSFV